MKNKKVYDSSPTFFALHKQSQFGVFIRLAVVGVGVVWRDAFHPTMTHGTRDAEDDVNQ